MTNSERYLTIRILYPMAGPTYDVLSAVEKVGEEARRDDLKAKLRLEPDWTKRITGLSISFCEAEARALALASPVCEMLTRGAGCSLHAANARAWRHQKSISVWRKKR